VLERSNGALYRFAADPIPPLAERYVDLGGTQCPVAGTVEVDVM